MTFEEYLTTMEDGQKNAILRKVARGLTGDETKVEEVLRGVLSGEFSVVVRDATVKFVDRHGRWIPLAGMTDVVDANYKFHLVQPEINYAAVHARFTRFMPEHAFVSVDEFRERSQAVIERVRQDRQIANLLAGVYLPLCFPQCEMGDYGTTLEDIFLSAVGGSYCNQFPDRTFQNCRAGELAEQVTVVAGTRHERLVAAMRTGPTVGVYFPTCLQGFSIPADRTLVRQLPDDCLLTGAIEPAMGYVGYPEVLGRDGTTPVSDCAAVQWQDPEGSLFFRPYGGELGFGRRRLVAYDHCSGGVLVLR